MIDAELLWSGPGHAVGRWQNVFVQVRWGEMTLAVLDAIEMAAHLARTRQMLFRRRGGLIVLAAEAPPSTGAVRQRQQEQVKRFIADEDLYVSIVIEGEGLYANLQRASARSMIGSARRGIWSRVDEGAAWLLGEISETRHAPRLVEFVRGLRKDQAARSM